MESAPEGNEGYQEMGLGDVIHIIATRGAGRFQTIPRYMESLGIWNLFSRHVSHRSIASFPTPQFNLMLSRRLRPGTVCTTVEKGSEVVRHWIR